MSIENLFLSLSPVPYRLYTSADYYRARTKGLYGLHIYIYHLYWVRLFCISTHITGGLNERGRVYSHRVIYRVIQSCRHSFSTKATAKSLFHIVYSLCQRQRTCHWKSCVFSTYVNGNVYTACIYIYLQYDASCQGS